MEGKDRWYKQGAPLLGEIKRAGPGPGAAHVWFMGQHGFVIALGGLVCYIDVILNPLPGGGGRDCRAYPPPFGPDQADRVDYYLCTHDHEDHLNLNIILPLAKANPQVRFIVPQPCRTLLTAAGIGESRVLGAEAHKTIALSQDAEVIPVPAVHTPFIQKDGEKDAQGSMYLLISLRKYG